MISIRLAATLTMLCMVSVPFSASAADFVVGSIDVTSLTSVSAKPTLSGMAIGAKSVKVTIQKEGSNKTFFRSKTIQVKNDKWKAKITKKLPDGIYTVTLSTTRGADFNSTPSGVLTIGKPTTASVSSVVKTGATTLVVSPVPLLQGGVARAGASVPLSYLQVTNTGKESATVKGFWVKQNGSAPEQAVIGLTTIDDKGASRGSAGGIEGYVLFKNGLAFAPTDAVLAPGQMRLFTIRAILTNNVSAYTGKQLMIDVASVETSAKVTGTFPIRGTTWTISK